MLSGLKLSDIRIENHRRFGELYAEYSKTVHHNIISFFTASKVKKSFNSTTLAQLLKKMNSVQNTEHRESSSRTYYFCVDSEGKITDNPVSVDSSGIIHNKFNFKKVVYLINPHKISEEHLEGEDPNTDAEVWADISSKSPGHDPSQPGFARDNRDPRDTSFFNPNSMSPDSEGAGHSSDPRDALDTGIDAMKAIVKEYRSQGLSDQEIQKRLDQLRATGNPGSHRVQEIMHRTRIAKSYILKNIF